MHRAVTVSIALVALGVGPQSVAEPSSPEVIVYSQYFEADGMRFESVEELREYLLSAPRDFYGVFFRDCAAKGREQELMKVISEVLFKRRAQREERGPVELGSGSVPCP